MADDDALPPGGYRVDNPVWQPWAPSEVLARLQGITAPWYIAAGWSLDLFRGEQIREHEDTEIGLPNSPQAFSQVRAALSGCEFEVVGSGLFWPVDSPAFERMHQTWVSEAGPPEADGHPGAPQFVLLFKAKANRPKDQADLDGVLPLLASHERAWLAATLRRIHPGHSWLERL